MEPEEWTTTPHVQNFLKAVRSRNPKDLTCDIEEGYFSAALCHMADISYRTGRKLHFDPKTERFVNDEEANSYITRKYREPFVVPERNYYSRFTYSSSRSAAPHASRLPR